MPEGRKTQEASKWNARTHIVEDGPLGLQCLTMILVICVVEEISMTFRPGDFEQF